MELEYNCPTCDAVFVCASDLTQHYCEREIKRKRDLFEATREPTHFGVPIY